MKKYNGFYRAIIEDNDDPENMGRVKARIMGIHSQNKTKSKTDGIPTDELPWIEQANGLFGGFGDSGAGISAVPEINSWIWIFFEQGDFARPIYFATITAKNDRDSTADKDDITIINSKSGHKITINDKEGEEKIEIKSKSGHTILLDDNNENFQFTGNGDVTITNANGDKIVINADGGIDIQAKDGGSIEKTVLGESLKTFIQNTIINTYNSHLHNNLYVMPLIPIATAPVAAVPPSQSMTNGDYLSDENKNN